MKLKIYYINGTVNEVLILPYKNTNTYSYINLTKGHICPCKFSSIEDALNDLIKYRNIISHVEGYNNELR